MCYPNYTMTAAIRTTYLETTGGDRVTGYSGVHAQLRDLGRRVARTLR